MNYPFSFCLILFSLYSLFYHLSCASSDYELYTLCSKTFSCGEHADVYYPLWGRGREACGHPDFKLNCSGGFAEFPLWPYMITLRRSDYINNLYPRNPLNVQFNEDVVSFSPDTELLTVYYDCPNFSSISHDNHYVGEFVSGNDRRNYYVTKNLTSPSLDDIRGLLNNFSEMCKRNVSIPASGSALETLQRSPSQDNLKKAIEQGFDLYVNLSCRRCTNSGGACGYKQTSNLFVCYCKDGPQRSTCQRHDGADLTEGIVWAMRMKVLLRVHKVWEAIEPGTTEEDKNDIATALLFQSIPENLIMQIGELDSPKEIWELKKFRLWICVMYGGPTSCFSLSHWICRLVEEERLKKKDE
ncbi:hypothetical protein N665_0966s0006 [Sinapis alba]|nr:hypothetical protein N665_0966s0006 [Sinapis alba]